MQKLPAAAAAASPPKTCGRVIDIVSNTVNPLDLSGPYLQHRRVVVTVEEAWNPNYDQRALCKCGHEYFRHFDTLEDMFPIGCKFCECERFEPAK